MLKDKLESFRVGLMVSAEMVTQFKVIMLFHYARGNAFAMHSGQP